MRKFLFILLAGFACSTAIAQNYGDSDYYYFEGLEKNQQVRITPAQKKQIVEIRKSIDRRHTAIGKDASLSGREKGRAHRELNRQARSEINGVLTPDQQKAWSKLRGESAVGQTTAINRIESELDDLDRQLDKLEDYYDVQFDELGERYDARLDALEEDASLTRAERDSKKRALKDERDAQKHALKTEKEAKVTALKEQKQVLKKSWLGY